VREVHVDHASHRLLLLELGRQRRRRRVLRLLGEHLGLHARILLLQLRQLRAVRLGQLALLLLEPLAHLRLKFGMHGITLSLLLQLARLHTPLAEGRRHRRVLHAGDGTEQLALCLDLVLPRLHHRVLARGAHAAVRVAQLA
jgi:hypothetical protein